MSDILAKLYHDIVSNFLEWVLEEKLKEIDTNCLQAAQLGNPITRIQSKKTGAKLNSTNLNFDNEFRFLLQIDPALEDWRTLAAEWWPQQRGKGHLATALNEFFIKYLHGCQVDKRPETVFDIRSRLPDLREALKRDSPSKFNPRYERRLHDAISDFLEWTMRKRLVETDTDGYQVVPPHFRNPFPREQAKHVGRGADLTFGHILNVDPRMVLWQALAAEWMAQLRGNEGERRNGLDLFLTTYIAGCGQERDPRAFCHVEPQSRTLLKSC